MLLWSEELGSICSSVSPSPTHLSHTRNITLSRIKRERYIFIKKSVHSFIEVRHYVWLCSAYICICIVVTITHLIMFLVVHKVKAYYTTSTNSVWKIHKRRMIQSIGNIFCGSVSFVRIIRLSVGNSKTLR